MFRSTRPARTRSSTSPDQFPSLSRNPRPAPRVFYLQSARCSLRGLRSTLELASGISMGLFSQLPQVLGLLLWLVPLLVLLTYLRSPTVKGWLGEKLVKLKARCRLPAPTYLAFHDVTISDEVGTTQIDHVFISPFGVFVVETKNLKGWIFGNPSDNQWTQVIFKHKTKFQNPLNQNFKHIKALERTLRLPISAFHSVIVFVGDCRLKSPFPANVCTLANFDRYILGNRREILNPDQVQAAADRIEKGRLRRSAAIARTHVAELRRRHLPRNNA